MSDREHFVELCLAGEADLQDIHDFIDAWHQSSEEVPLHEFLGLTKREYDAWLEEPTLLRYIINAKRSSIPFQDVVGKMKRMIAARSGDANEARILEDWLSRTGRI